MATLGHRFDARHNNFDLIRLLLAGLVAVAHGIVIHTGTQPSWGMSTLGDFAVDGFFVLSGFLVTRSYLQLASFPRFTWHRFLRIMPAFWTCLLVMALVVGPLGAVLAGQSVLAPFTQEPSAWRFLAVNSALFMAQYDIGQIFGGNPTPLVVNGALWTLVLEAMCYALIGGIGLVGLLRRRRWVVPMLAGALWLVSIAQAAQVPVPLGDDTVRLVMMFLLGATAFVYADRIPLAWTAAVAAALLFLGSAAWLENYRLIGAVPLSYVLIWLAVGLPRSLRLRTDLSYGTYIYHWPLQQLLVLTPVALLPTGWFVVFSLVGVTLLAVASWFAIEKPSLARKSVRFPRWLDPGRVPAVAEPVEVVATSGAAGGPER